MAVVAEGRVANAYADDLVIEPLLVSHPHDADCARFDDRQRMQWLLPKHQRVKRIAVVAEGSRNEALDGRIMDCAEENAIQAKQSCLLVQLVLVH